MAKTFKVTSVLLLLLCVKVEAVKNFAEGTFLYDAQINGIMKKILAPLAQKAGIDIKKSDIAMIVSSSYNAWASVDNNFGVHTQFLRKSKTAAEFLSIMAHEFGHVNARHIGRMDGTFGKIASQGMVVTGVAALAGLALGPGAVIGALLGGMSVTERAMMYYSRAQEHTADQKAIDFLKSLNWPVSSFKNAMMTMKEETVLYPNRDSYVLSHPPTPERLEYLGNSLNDNPQAKIPEEFTVLWDLVLMKLKGLLDDPNEVINELKNEESEGALLATSLAYYRLDSYDQALVCADKLIALKPNSPHYHDLKSDIMWDQGNIREAKNEAGRAKLLDPDEPLFKQNYAKALVELKEDLPQAAKILEDVALNNRRFSNSWRSLAQAYGALNRMGEFYWAQAEYFVLIEKKDEAISYSKKAEGLIDKQSKYYLYLKVLQDKIKEIFPN